MVSPISTQSRLFAPKDNSHTLESDIQLAELNNKEDKNWWPVFLQCSGYKILRWALHQILLWLKNDLVLGSGGFTGQESKNKPVNDCRYDRYSSKKSKWSYTSYWPFHESPIHLSITWSVQLTTGYCY